VKKILVVGPISDKIDRVYEYIKEKHEVWFIPFHKLNSSEIKDYDLILVLIDLTANTGAKFGIISKNGLLNAINIENKSEYFISAITNFKRTNIIPIKYFSVNKLLQDLKIVDRLISQQLHPQEANILR